MTLLEVCQLSKSFANGALVHRVLDRIDLTVDDGEFVVLVGPSGAGKSTLLALLAGLQRPDAGSITLAGAPIVGPGRDRGFVFQQESLLPWLTAYENVKLAVDATYPAWTAVQRRERTERTLELVNLAHAHDKRPAQLSGGMRQRVAVARALAMDPKILLLDEPFSALDALTRATLQEELERIRQADRKTVLMVTNDLDEALLLADRIVPLSRAGALGESIRVGLAHPRRRAELAIDPAYKALRHRLADALIAMTGQEAAAATQRYPLPSIVPDHGKRAPRRTATATRPQVAPATEPTQ